MTTSLTFDPLGLRPGRIGSSQIAAVIDVNPYRNQYQVWEEITGRSAFTGNVRTRRGQILEAPVAELFLEEKYPGLRLEPGRTLIGLEPWMVDTPDRFVYEGDHLIGVLEIKCVGSRLEPEWGDPADRAVPPYVLAQIFWHLLNTNAPVGWVVAFFTIDDIRIYEFTRAADYEEKLVNMGRSFYENHVEIDHPPAPGAIDGSDWARSYLDQVNRNRTGLKLLATEQINPQLFEKMNLLRHIETNKRALEAQSKLMRNELIAGMGKHSGIMMEDGSQFRAIPTKKGTQYRIDFQD